MEALRQILQQPGWEAPLDLPALELVQLERPAFEPSPYLHCLDQWAAELRNGSIGDLHGHRFVSEFHRFFFGHLGFRGNEDDYYNPLNSFLNEVMDRRKGIPITLAVLYIELARRIGRKVHGIGFPGHFLVKVEDGDYSGFVDVFRMGRLMSREDCIQMGVELTGIDCSDRPQVLEPVDTRSILLRMLQNLRGIYLTRRANRKLLAVQNLLLLACPEDAEEFFSRAMVKMNLHLHASAERDLLQFLKLRPESDLKGEVRKQLELVRVMRSQMN